MWFKKKVADVDISWIGELVAENAESKLRYRYTRPSTGQK